MSSAIYWGNVRHRRKSPVQHQFDYDLFMVYLDLDELPELLDNLRFCSTKGAAPVRYKRTDYMGPHHLDLHEAVREKVTNETGLKPEGPIRMLTHLRYFGFCFNPVTFYYCFNREDTEVVAIAAEITNTPWGERHTYVMSRPSKTAANGAGAYHFPKNFHVSPFMPMEQDYAWYFNPPGERLWVHMENLQDGERTFDATLTMERKPLTQKTINRAMMRFPLMTWKVTAAIYYQALKLRLKGVPFFNHPEPDQQLFASK